MPYFSDADEIDTYIGGMMRAAVEDPVTGPKIRAADLVLRMRYTDPQAEMTIFMKPTPEVVMGAVGEADVTMTLSGDIADRFWRGDYSLPLGLAKGQVKAQGPVKKVLKLLPLAKEMFPMYRTAVKDKDAGRA